MEKSAHKLLKLQAIEMLKDLGFKETEIQEEYPVTITASDSEKKIGKSVTYRVDVAGISFNKRVAVECGRTPATKIVWLKPFFDEIMLLPHIRTFTTEEEKSTYQLRIVKKKFAETEKKLKERVKELKAKKAELEQKLSNMERMTIVTLLDFLSKNTSWSELDLDYNGRNKLDRWRQKQKEIADNIET